MSSQLDRIEEKLDRLLEEDYAYEVKELPSNVIFAKKLFESADLPPSLLTSEKFANKVATTATLVCLVESKEEVLNGN